MVEQQRLVFRQRLGNERIVTFDAAQKAGDREVFLLAEVIGDARGNEVDAGGHIRHGVALTADAVNETDAVVIVTDHRVIDYQMLMDNASLIVDSRNATAGLVKTKARVVSLASARPTAEAALDR